MIIPIQKKQCDIPVILGNKVNEDGTFSERIEKQLCVVQSILNLEIYMPSFESLLRIMWDERTYGLYEKKIMKIVLCIVTMLLPLVAFSQKLSCADITQIYTEVIQDFQTYPLEIHVKDKEMLVTKPKSCKTKLPLTIGGEKVKWANIEGDLATQLKGRLSKHNGRSVLLISLKNTSFDTISVRIDQWTIGNLENEMSFTPINEDTYPVYKKKNHDFIFVKINSQWQLTNKIHEAHPLTPEEQNIEDIFQRGNTLFREGKFKEALEKVELSMSMDSSMYQRYLFKAEINTKLKRYDSAISDITKAIERCDCSTRKSHVPSYYMKRAEVQIKNKKYSEAFADINKSILLNPESWKAYFVKANIFIDRVEYKKALDNLNKSIELNNKQAYVYYVRSYVHYNLGHTKKSCSDFKMGKQLGLGKSNTWARKNCE